MPKRTLVRIGIGAAVLLVGGYVFFFTIINPIIGGCRTYTNGTVLCGRSYDYLSMLLGIFLLFLGAIQIAYAFRTRTAKPEQPEKTTNERTEPNSC